jgi:hypothetical protein
VRKSYVYFRTLDGAASSASRLTESAGKTAIIEPVSWQGFGVEVY